MAPRNLFLVMFPGFELLDLAGPAEFFGNLKEEMHIITVAETKGCVVGGSSNVKWSADYTFDEVTAGAAGPINWFLVPGGYGTPAQVTNAPILHFLRHAAASAELVMSVCTGTALLAAAGLLEGRRATSNKQSWAWMKSVTPSPLFVKKDGAPAAATAVSGAAGITWVYKARWVWDGPVVTAGGVSAGMDMALAVITKFFGEAKAKELEAFGEYEAHTDPSWDPFSDLYPEPEAEKAAAA